MEAKIETLWNEVRELNLGTSGELDRLDSPPTPLQFLRDFVSQNKPCIISNATNHWPALTRWTSDSYLTSALSSSLVSLHLTPHGRADSLVPSSTSSICFASAHVHRTPFPEALRLIKNDSSFVAYAQQQNNCFPSEYSSLAADCDPHIQFATSALGSRPEAVNMWIGDERSTTSFHKDHYENLYAVVTGQKHFLLLPPTDVHRMYIREYPAAKYTYSPVTGEFELELESPARTVPWCSVDPYPAPEDREEQVAKYPSFFNGPRLFRCSINPGEMLYLPSMWFHHVRQSPDSSGRTIAVNYWYDMQFDIKYAYFNFLQSIQCPLIEREALAETVQEVLDFDAPEKTEDE